jgi:anoctamin-10
VGLYFHFLATYAKALTVISAFGGLFWLLGESYSPYYSIALILWATTFVEYWAIVERKISVKWGTYGAFRVEKLRHDYISSADSPLQQDLHRATRMAASIPVILGFVAVLAGILTTLFAVEAFITRLYTGPFHQHVVSGTLVTHSLTLIILSFFPKGLFNTILFMASVPNFLAVYQKHAVKMTNLENHKHQSTYDYSLTIKRFLLSAVVAYLGLTLSAFVYVPFGQQIMTFVHLQLDTRSGLNETAEATKDAASAGIWHHDIGNITTSIDITRLQNQMYAYTVTNQIVGTFLEVGLPYIMRFLGRVQGGAAKGKRVDFKDEDSGMAKSGGTNGGDERKEDRELLVKIRKEVALGRGYDVFEDYLEMVTQFGYVAIWSTIWPLAPGASLFEQLVQVKCSLTIPFKSWPW